ncbi:MULTISPECIES: hypothetical protein [unclassified Mesorhizobium]|uniref:hypothetical protein n=1 Tax=unclassified Mesorhizobium TaxID=325217 RepID=UPI0015E3F448|nr:MULTISPECIES: hypothetical protein [unclassified Mesorhizobium]MBZ9982121.1 hypothetical protein [Mesorhizobium sp. BR-1-1-8]
MASLDRARLLESAKQYGSYLVINSTLEDARTCFAGLFALRTAMTLISRIAALALLAVIVFATLSPIQMRPHLGDPDFERALAYVLFGVAMGLGFPNRLAGTVTIVVVVATVLELMQLLEPGRHARLSDGSLKALAGILGIVVVHLSLLVASRYWPRKLTLPAE